MAAPSDAAPLNPTAAVRLAVETLHREFYEPLRVPDLLLDAWEGAAGALMTAGAPAIPAARKYPNEPGAAYAVHDAAFPALEGCARGYLSTEQLLTAALAELLARRRDGHTFLSTPRMAERGRSVPRPPATSLGLVLTDTRPPVIADVTPASAAQRAGLRRGDTLLRVNGRSAVSLRRFAALAEFNRVPDLVNEVTVRTTGGEEREVSFQPDPQPSRLIARVVDSPRARIGVLRVDGFGPQATDRVRDALTAFEREGVSAWIFDVRWNSGGESIGVSRLLVPTGRLFSRLRHNDTVLSDGREVPKREDIEADGTALPFQRPAAILIGPGSLSGAESFAGPMQTHRRAALVGERTGGLCGRMGWTRLAPGWMMGVAHYETVFDPEERTRNRVGVEPDVPVSPTPDDEAAGRDPQLAAALDLLQAQLGG